MSYIRVPKPTAAQAVKRTVIDNFSGGVCIDENHSALSDRQSPDMLNMCYENNTLSTRDGQKKTFVRAVKRTYMKNLSPLFRVNAASYALLTPSGAGVLALSSEGNAVELTLPQTPAIEGFRYDIKAEKKRKLLIVGEVMNTGMVTVYFNEKGLQLHQKNISITKSASSFVKFSATVTVGDTDLYRFTVCDGSYEAGNKTTWRSIYLFDYTYAPDAELNSYIPSFITDFPAKDFSTYPDISALDYSQYNAQDKGQAGYFLDGGSFGIYSSELIGSTVNAFIGEALFDLYFFHAGTNIYSWSGGSDELPMLCGSNILLDLKSMSFVFLSRAYFMDGTNYITVKAEPAGDGHIFIAEKVEPFVPTVMVNAVNGYGTVKGDYNEPYNLIGKKYSVTYNTTPNISLFYLLNWMHYANGVTIEVNGKELAASEYTITPIPMENMAYVQLKTPFTETTAGFNNLKITCSQGTPEYDTNRRAFYKCTISSEFGGGNAKGTRMFFSGNPDDPAKYYRSYIMNCTYIPELEYDYVGAGTEKITAFELQYGDLIVFTESSVYQITYSFDGTNANFACKLLNYAVGCDMPGSVCLADNRIVFANSAGGVYVIDYFNNTDEKNIKQISLNVNGSKFLGRGLISEDKAALRSAAGFTYGGRYYLHIGVRTYVWDYGLRGFDFSGEYYDRDSENAQRKLAWYIYDNIHAKYFFRFRDKNAMGYITDAPTLGSGVCFVEFDSFTGDFGNAILSHYQTKAFDFGIFMYKKRLSDVSVAYYAKYDAGAEDFSYGNIKLTCICDSAWSKSYITYRRQFTEGEDDNSYNLCKFKTELKKAFFHAVRFESIDAPINIAKVVMGYTV